MSVVDPHRPDSQSGDLADRILDAARRLIVRVGTRKLSLSDVAKAAGVSRPTIYRYFLSKEDLIDALGSRERRRFAAAMDGATGGVTGSARLSAAVDVVATFVLDQPSGRLVDLEPHFAHEQMARALPMITETLTAVLQLCHREGALDSALVPHDVAGAICRIALSHYIFADCDDTSARRQIRAAAGLSTP